MACLLGIFFGFLIVSVVNALLGNLLQCDSYICKIILVILKYYLFLAFQINWCHYIIVLMMHALGVFPYNLSQTLRVIYVASIVICLSHQLV